MIIDQLCESYVKVDFLSILEARILSLCDGDTSKLYEAEDQAVATDTSSELKKLAAMYLSMYMFMTKDVETKPDSLKKAITKFGLNVTADDVDKASGVRFMGFGDKGNSVETMFVPRKDVEGKVASDKFKVNDVTPAGPNGKQLGDALRELTKRDPSVLKMAHEITEFIKDEDAETETTVSTLTKDGIKPVKTYKYNPRKSLRAMSPKELA